MSVWFNRHVGKRYMCWVICAVWVPFDWLGFPAVPTDGVYQRFCFLKQCQLVDGAEISGREEELISVSNLVVGAFINWKSRKKIPLVISWVSEQSGIFDMDIFKDYVRKCFRDSWNSANMRNMNPTVYGRNLQANMLKNAFQQTEHSMHNHRI